MIYYTNWYCFIKMQLQTTKIIAFSDSYLKPFRSISIHWIKIAEETYFCCCWISYKSSYFINYFCVICIEFIKKQRPIVVCIGRKYLQQSNKDPAHEQLTINSEHGVRNFKNVLLSLDWNVNKDIVVISLKS